MHFHENELKIITIYSTFVKLPLLLAKGHTVTNKTRVRSAGFFSCDPRSIIKAKADLGCM